MDDRRAASEAFGTGARPFEVRDPGRREFSEALSAFISVLGDAPSNPGSLTAIFSCGSSGLSDSGGGENFCNDKAVAIDGTASGILDQLPVFCRDEMEVECLKTKYNTR